MREKSKTRVGTTTHSGGKFDPHVSVISISTCKDYPVPARLSCSPSLCLADRFILWRDSYDPGGPVVVEGDSSLFVSLPKRLRSRNEDHLYEGNQLAEDEPDVDVLDVGRLWQGLHHGDENRCEDQHVGQVHSQVGVFHTLIRQLILCV